MADLVQVPADVQVFAPVSQEFVKCGELLDQGMPVYFDPATELYMKADASAAETAKAAGITLTKTTVVEQYFQLVRSGLIGLGATLEVGKPYVVSVNPGKIAPVDDLASGWFPTILGYAQTADEFEVKISVSSVAIV